MPNIRYRKLLCLCSALVTLSNRGHMMYTEVLYVAFSCVLPWLLGPYNAFVLLSKQAKPKVHNSASYTV